MRAARTCIGHLLLFAYALRRTFKLLLHADSGRLRRVKDPRRLLGVAPAFCRGPTLQSPRETFPKSNRKCAGPHIQMAFETTVPARPCALLSFRV
ncbi:MAG: hypothetical protein QOF74_7231 [Caballeronia mineralivorans]|nr:hypothetical protein [Caballeronia mineralivorans]